MTPPATLDQISRRLTDTPPLELIDTLMPIFASDAITWARRLPHWDEFRGQYPDQAVSLARVVSRRAMREFGLAMTDDGRVVERHAPMPRPVPEMTFPLVVAGQEVQVHYARSYFPSTARDGLSFTAESNPLSESGHWHQFIDHDAVEACGGPKAFAALYAEAKLTGRANEFIDQVEGRLQEGNRPHRKKPKRADRPAIPVLGEHSAAVMEARESNAGEQTEPQQPVKQRQLF
jgi:hypothetical protein